MKKIKLKSSEKIIAVIPETAKYPGWQDDVVWIHIIDTETNKYRCDMIPKNKITPKMRSLFEVGERVCNGLIASVPTIVDD